MEQQTKPFSCMKCSHNMCDIAEIRATGGAWSKFFNIQNQRFTTITCKQCAFTELYKKQSSTAGNILDFFGN